MFYRHLALATAVGALAACASSGSNTTDETLTPTTTTATTDSLGAATGVTTTDTATTGGVSPTTADSASGRVATGMAGGEEAAAAAQLDTMIAIAERGFASAPTEAVNAITGFQSYLSTANNPALSDVTTDLDALKSELQKPTVDQQAVNAVLARIGPKVSAAASTAGANSDRLTRLGQALTKAGGGM